MEITIRQALESDIPAIMNLLLQVNDVHADGRPDLFMHGHTKYNQETLKKIMTDHNTPIFVGTGPEGHLLGYCFCIIEDHAESNNLKPVKTLYIDDLCVDATLRGKHVGRTIYNAVMNYASQNGFYNITLNVWCCNPSAIKFYESLGMEPMKISMEAILS